MSPAPKGKGPGKGGKPLVRDARGRITGAKTKAADMAAREAKAVKAVGPLSSPLAGGRRHLRDSAIVARVGAGYTPREAAKEFEVTPRTVERVLARAASQPSALDRTPMDLVERELRRSERMVADFMALTTKYEDVHPSSAVGALKAAADEGRVFVHMLIEIGKLPENLEVFRTTAEVRQLMRGLMERLDRFEEGLVTASEVVDYVRDVVTGVRPLEEDAIEGHGRELPPGTDPDPADG